MNTAVKKDTRIPIINVVAKPRIGPVPKLNRMTPVSRNLMTNTRFDFMGTKKKSLIITVAIILVCIGSFAMRGLSQSIDFTGGRNFKVQFENPVEPEQIRELISSKFGDANVSVIAIGTDKKTVRISTNYRIEDAGNDTNEDDGYSDDKGFFVCSHKIKTCVGHQVS